MGVTISSKTKEIDLGYFGFNRLRTKVAELCNKEIFDHYNHLKDSIYIFRDEDVKKFFNEYNKKTKEIDEKYDMKFNAVLHFLYASDCEASMDVDVCKAIYEVIKTFDDDKTIYGYSGRSDAAVFNDFKDIVKDCIDNNCAMQWS